MLPASLRRIEERLDPADVVLDVGGWAEPLPRADWVIDVMPYETRGLYGTSDPELERFDERTWIQRDMCDREPFPFADAQIDFAVCSHTLEDVRDPIWVCRELSRVAKAGYIEVPSRLEEQSYGVHGPWVGWSHHRWLVDVTEDRLEFVSKPHALHGKREFQMPHERWLELSPEQRVEAFFWEAAFECSERIFLGPGEIDEYLASLVRPHRGGGRAERPGRGRWRLPRR